MHFTCEKHKKPCLLQEATLREQKYYSVRRNPYGQLKKNTHTKTTHKNKQKTHMQSSLNSSVFTYNTTDKK